MKDKKHTSALLGLGLSLLCLSAFGADGFIIPAMAAILWYADPHEKADGGRR